MFRYVVFSIALVLIAVVTSIPTDLNNASPVVIVDFNSGIEENAIQDASVIQELFSSTSLSAIPAAQPEATLRYSIGKRIKNDRIVSQNTDSHRWPSPQNVTFILQYPSSGQGAIVTYVEVVVDQTSKLGRAHVLAGGIGQRFITVIVESNSTYWFNYSARIYGF